MVEELNQECAMHRFVFACLVLALMAQGAGAEGQTALNGIDDEFASREYTLRPDGNPEGEVFHMVVIGDSIAWGAGLKADQKYCYQVADWLKNKLNKPVNVKNLAHVGAVLQGISGEQSCNPNCGSKYPSVEDQVDQIQDPESVDLILLSGGINDVGVFNIIDADMSKEDITYLAEANKISMRSVLEKLLKLCPDSNIIVTNYYPIVTEPTTESLSFQVEYTYFYTFLHAGDIKISLPGDYSIVVPFLRPQPYGCFEKLVDNSAAFDTTSTNSIRDAVDMANKYSEDRLGEKQKRVAFADVDFPPERCYNTKNSLLWKLVIIDEENKKFVINDNLAGYRLENCPCCHDCVYSPVEAINAIGHPNEEGATRYTDAIKAKISPIVQAFQVMPLSFNRGESLKIDYTVSDISDLGLKQVELWRTQEKDKWPEDPIQTKTLASESGPLSDSFTDSPSAPGKYWYGVHVVDNAGNWNDQTNSNTNGQPSSFEPVEVEVKSSQEVTLTLYVHDGSVDGPLLSGAEVAGQDADGRSFSQTTDANGFVVLTGTPGSWQFTATKPGYAVNSWSQEIAAKCTKHAFLFVEEHTAETETVETQAPLEEWNRTFGRAGFDRANSVQPTFDGIYIFAGSTSSFGAGESDAWLVKTDAHGNELWNRTFGRVYNDGAYSIQCTSDGGYILAGVTGVIEADGFGDMDAWLIKTDANGYELWNRTFSGADGRYYDLAWSVQPTSDGGYILAGQTSSSSRTGIDDAWLIKTDRHGNQLWNKTFGEVDYHDIAYSVQPTVDDGYVIGGGTSSKLMLLKTDYEGNEIWSRTFGGINGSVARSVQLTSDGGYILAGATTSFGAVQSDAWLIKTDAEGNELWNMTFRREGFCVATSVQPTSDSGYILAGIFCAENRDSSLAAVLMKTDSQGNEIWNKTFGGLINDWANSVQPTPDGGYILAGETTSFGASQSDAWLIKLTPV